MKGIAKLLSIALVVVIAVLLVAWVLGVLPLGSAQEAFIDTLLVLVISTAAVGMIGLLVRIK